MCTKKKIKTKYQIVLILIEYFLLFVYELPQHGITIYIKLKYDYIRWRMHNIIRIITMT